MDLHLEDSNLNTNTDFTIVDKIGSQENIDASNLNSNDEEKNEANNDSKQKKLN